MSKKIVLVTEITLVVFFIFSALVLYKYAKPTSGFNDIQKAINMIIEDVEDSISRKREFFYHIECCPRCGIVEEIMTLGTELRKSIERANAAGVNIKVLVPLNTPRNYIKQLNDAVGFIEIRIASEEILNCFRVSGSLVFEENLIEGGETRKYKRYRYVPGMAQRMKSKFESVWVNATSLQKSI